uniref:Chemokine interleukin-8-like domain-containing protein n=1 Tax=Salmo trutta TaxID=8032 RepID=A0A673WH81_SALTR
MMGCLMVTGVLLVILLFHPPAAQMESPDTDVEDVRFEEFCLKISDDSHCTTAEPEPRQTVTNKSTQLAMSSPSDDKEGIPPRRGELGPIEREGCRCKTWQEHTTDQSLVMSIEFRFPAPDVCNSTEIIETLADGRKVCVNTSLTRYLAPLFGPSTDQDWEGTTTPSPNISAVSPSPTTQIEEQISMTPPGPQAPPAPPGSPAPPAPPAPPGPPGPPGPPAPNGSSGRFGQQGPSLQRCMCIETESRRIGRLISKVQFYPPSSSCNVAEVIATLKTSGQEICLEVTAPWVRKILEKFNLVRLPLKELT